MLLSILEDIEQRIKKEGISSAENARSPLSIDDKQRKNTLRSEIDSIKVNFYDPIKAEIKNDYGEHFANFLLSNRKTIIVQ